MRGARATPARRTPPHLEAAELVLELRDLGELVDRVLVLLLGHVLAHARARLHELQGLLVLALVRREALLQAVDALAQRLALLGARARARGAGRAREGVGGGDVGQ